MTVYIDLVIILNFCYDFLILMTVDITLKRNTKIRRMVIGALIGSLALLLLFLKINNILLFLFKILISIIMVIVTYSYKDLKYTFNNLFYLYMCSVILAGFLYLLNVNLSYRNIGLVFVNNGLSINYLVLLFLAPLILFLYIYQNKKIKNFYHYIVDVKIVFNDQENILVQGYIDTGNVLKDPITNKYIILLENNLLNLANKRPIYVPFVALNKKGLLECFKINYIEINNQKFSNYLVGIHNGYFHLEGINCLLNRKLLEELCLEN